MVKERDAGSSEPGKPKNGVVYPFRELSSAVEHAVHIGRVTGSIPVAPTNHFSDSTTHKGDVAEMLAAAELLRRGYRVSRPLSNGAPYDLIIDDGARLFKVQVKKATEADGTLRANLSASKYHRGRTRVLYNLTCDVVIVVDCSAVTFYAFCGQDLNATELRLRLVPTRNGQSANVRNAADFEMSGVFPHLRGSPATSRLASPLAEGA